MTYVNVTDDLCDPGKFTDTLAPDVRKRAVTIDATQRAQVDRLWLLYRARVEECDLLREEVQNLRRELAAAINGGAK